LNDRLILQAIKEGKDSPVLSELYKCILPKVKQYVLKNQGSVDDAKDVFQEAVIAFFRQVKLGKFKEEYEISAYIYTASKNFWITKVKRSKSYESVAYIEQMEGEEINMMEGMIVKERSNSTLKLLDLLGEHCKTLLSYSVYDSLSMKEIAQKMNYANENAAKTANYKCKKRLVEMIESNPEYSELLK
jgi:RNA polymerase sigma factor (sigma-70 family)